MFNYLRLTALGILLLAWPVFAHAQSMTESVSESSDQERVTFDAVQAVFRKHCVSCHNEDQPRGDLVLTSLDKVLAGSSSGFVVVPGKVGESPLYTLTAHLDNPKMPPNKPRIPQRELNLIERWINTGLVDEAKQSGKVVQEDTDRSAMTEKVATDSLEGAPSKVADKESDHVSRSYCALKPLMQPTPIRAIAMHPNQSILAVGTFGQVAFARAETGEFLPDALELPNLEITVLKFSRDGKVLWIAAGVPGESGEIRRWDWEKKEWLPPLGSEQDTILAMDLSSDGKRLAIGTPLKTVKTFDVDSNQLLHTHKKHTDWVLSVSYSPDGLLLATGDRFGGIQIWESETGAEFATLRGHTGGVTGMAWSQDGNQLTSCSLDGTVRVWDMHSFETKENWVAHKEGVLALVKDRNGLMLTGGRDRTIRQWGSDGSKPVCEFETDADPLTLVSSSFGLNEIGMASDSTGSIHRITAMEKGTNDMAVRSFSLPLQAQPRRFADIAPKAPERVLMASLRKGAVEASELAKSPSDVVQKIASDELKASSSGPKEHGDRESDLEETKRAVASLEASLKETYKTAASLEESLARLKQLVILQEARIKQEELRSKQ
jgi:WD40 repeat protein